MIAADSNKIIKIYANKNSNNIIITIIQFYDNDSYMTIKIYNMINNNGFLYPKQVRINTLRNSYIITMSAENEKKRKPGYSIINYPNSTDINLSSSNIVIGNLISLENKLFSLKLKFKILDIPKDFIFYNKLNSRQINNNDELELNDELILRQFRIKEGQYELKYRAVARGTDSGFTSFLIYPTNKVKSNNEIFCEEDKELL